MDQQFQTSFIPKKPVTEARAPISRGGVSIFGLIATIAVVIAAILFGGSYFYRLSLVKQRDALTADIAAKTKTFDPNFLNEVTTLDRRIKAADIVLAGHTLVSPIFTKLEQLSLKTVQFTEFSLAPAATATEGPVTIKMSGRAVNYAAIASESDALTGVHSNKVTYFINPIFSNLNLDDKARVSFDLTFSVDKALISYPSYISRLSGDAPQQ
jgi:hypothetical protein